jgi:hypothetical protein
MLGCRKCHIYEKPGIKQDNYNCIICGAKMEELTGKKHIIKTKKKKKPEPCGTGLIDCYYNPQEEFNGTFKDKDIYSKIQ